MNQFSEMQKLHISQAFSGLQLRINTAKHLEAGVAVLDSPEFKVKFDALIEVPREGQTFEQVIDEIQHLTNIVGGYVPLKDSVAIASDFDGDDVQNSYPTILKDKFRVMFAELFSTTAIFSSMGLCQSINSAADIAMNAAKALGDDVGRKWSFVTPGKVKHIVAAGLNGWVMFSMPEDDAETMTLRISESYGATAFVQEHLRDLQLFLLTITLVGQPIFGVIEDVMDIAAEDSPRAAKRYASLKRLLSSVDSSYDIPQSTDSK